jgi:hypothetical protein
LLPFPVPRRRLNGSARARPRCRAAGFHCRRSAPRSPSPACRRQARRRRSCWQGSARRRGTVFWRARTRSPRRTVPPTSTRWSRGRRRLCWAPGRPRTHDQDLAAEHAVPILLPWRSIGLPQYADSECNDNDDGRGSLLLLSDNAEGLLRLSVSSGAIGGSTRSALPVAGFENQDGGFATIRMLTSRAFLGRGESPR